MDFGEAVKSCFSKYVTFSGRASRSEYWWFALFLVLGTFACALFDYLLLGAAETGVEPFGAIFGLGTLLPSLSVLVRRLHDIGRTGWWVLLWFVPIIGWIVILVFACTKSQPGPNQYGPNPLTGDMDVAEVFS